MALHFSIKLVPVLLLLEKLTQRRTSTVPLLYLNPLGVLGRTTRIPMNFPRLFSVIISILIPPYASRSSSIISFGPRIGACRRSIDGALAHALIDPTCIPFPSHSLVHFLTRRRWGSLSVAESNEQHQSRGTSTTADVVCLFFLFSLRPPSPPPPYQLKP